MWISHSYVCHWFTVTYVCQREIILIHSDTHMDTYVCHCESWTHMCVPVNHTDSQWHTYDFICVSLCHCESYVCHCESYVCHCESVRDLNQSVICVSLWVTVTHIRMHMCVTVNHTDSQWHTYDFICVSLWISQRLMSLWLIKIKNMSLKKWETGARHIAIRRRARHSIQRGMSRSHVTWLIQIDLVLIAISLFEWVMSHVNRTYTQNQSETYEVSFISGEPSHEWGIHRRMNGEPSLMCSHTYTQNEWETYESLTHIWFHLVKSLTHIQVQFPCIYTSLFIYVAVFIYVSFHILEYESETNPKNTQLGISRMNADSQWNPVYNDSD